MSDEKKSQDTNSKTFQEKVEESLANAFGWWGSYLSNNPWKVFLISFLVFIGLSGGMSKRADFEDQQEIWTPRDNPSMLANRRQKEMFPSKGGFIGLLFEVKDPETKDTIISIDAFKEIETFYESLKTVTHKSSNDQGDISWDSICIKIRQECFTGKSALSFVSNMQNTVDFTTIADDAALLAAVQSGQGGFNRGSGKIIEVNTLFGGTTPEFVEQDATTGQNNLEKAQAVSMSMPYQNGDFDKLDLQEFELKLDDEAIKFNEQSKHVNVYMFSNGALRQAFSADIQDDLAMVGQAITLVSIYCVIFMGSFSPIHFRSAAGGIALLCVGLSYGSSSGLAYLVGAKSAGIHNLLPFMLIGIGVDDMFVISSAIDQTNPRDSVEKRMREGMIHAGASITITSFTNAAAFFLGVTTSIDALSSFCFFCGLGVIALFFASITVFSAFMVWDLRRQAQRKGDCCGACCCSETTIICCKGSCLTKKQKSYPYQGEETDPVPEEKYINGTQKFLYEKFSLAITSKAGIATILVIWGAYIGISAWGVSNLDIDFKQSYFISPKAFVNEYIQRQDALYKSGEKITFYVDNAETDFTSIESQKNLNTLMDSVKNCKDCSQDWIKEETFDSWYIQFKGYSESKTGVSGDPCENSWDSTNGVVVPSAYMACLESFFTSPAGFDSVDHVLREGSPKKVVGFRFTVKTIFIKSSAKEGVDMLTDLQAICDNSPLPKTFVYGQSFYNYESYVVFAKEANMNIILALVAVLIVLLVFTGNVTVSLFVLTCVGLVDLFLFGLLTFWNVTLNSVTIINVVIAIGLAVDYSAHIGHAYLTVDPPNEDEQGNQLTNHQKRVFKARGALGQMGPSVFHGAFSTFLAIIVLSGSKSYIFKSFFKMWFGIIIFGVSNGFVLLPVILSLFGPLNKVHNIQENQVSDTEIEKNQKVKIDAKAQEINEQDIELTQKQNDMV